MEDITNVNENKSGKKRTVIIILAVAAVILACILLVMHGCTAGNDESDGAESGVSSISDGSDILNGVQSDDSADTSSDGVSDVESSTEPSQSDVASEPDISDTSVEIPAVSDEPYESNSTATGDSPVNSTPDEESKPSEESQPAKPVDNPKPETPPVTKVYNTEWGTRPFEFEEMQDITRFGMWGPCTNKGTLEEHVDRYHNTWYTCDGKVIGDGSIFHLGKLPKISGTKYLGNGYWSNGACWWKDGDPNIYNMPVITSFKITNPQRLGMKDDMVRGTSMTSFWMLFVENDLHARTIALECDSFEELFEKETEYLKSYGDDFYNDWKDDPVFDPGFYKRLNINSYADLIRAIADPFSYQFSKYTHDFN